MSMMVTVVDSHCWQLANGLPNMSCGGTLGLNDDVCQWLSVARSIDTAVMAGVTTMVHVGRS